MYLRMVSRAATLSLMMVTSGGCDAPGPEDVPAAGGSPQELEASRSPVPLIRGPIDCDAEEVRAPDLCSWLHSNDAVVWAKVISVELAEDLVIDRGLGGQGWKWVDQCADQVSPALKLSIEIIHAFHGGLRGRMDVRLGRDHRMMLDPLPEPGDDGSLIWTDQPPGAAGSPIVPGQSIGLALHQVEFDGQVVWSLMYEPMFGLGGDGLMRVGVYGRGWPEPPTEGIRGETLGTLTTQLEACAGAEASGDALDRRAGRRAWLYAEGAIPPTSSVAGQCFDSNHELPQCQTDRDCPAALPHCVFGVCAIQ
jgi:hypothetical protein